jgi:hypothetical protein
MKVNEPLKIFTYKLDMMDYTMLETGSLSYLYLWMEKKRKWCGRSGWIILTATVYFLHYYTKTRQNMRMFALKQVKKYDLSTQYIKTRWYRKKVFWRVTFGHIENKRVIWRYFLSFSRSMRKKYVYTVYMSAWRYPCFLVYPYFWRYESPVFFLKKQTRHVTSCNVLVFLRSQITSIRKRCEWQKT